jgi:tritrans,polycis-undecaprenyl-diphosphate synthase [geranylgeranyl-diphosphate specific]
MLVKAGKLEPEQIDEKIIEEHLYTKHLPQQEPDLVIRTGNESRLSNFLLWQAAYSELFIVDVYWPDFREIDLQRVIRNYQQRSRRYGK